MKAVTSLGQFSLNDFVTAVDQANSAARAIEATGVDPGHVSQPIAPQVQAALDQYDSNRWRHNVVNTSRPRIDRMRLFLWGVALGVVLSVALAWAVVLIIQAA